MRTRLNSNRFYNNILRNLKIAILLHNSPGFIQTFQTRRVECRLKGSILEKIIMLRHTLTTLRPSIYVHLLGFATCSPRPHARIPFHSAITNGLVNKRRAKTQFYDNCRNSRAFIGYFLLSICGETHEFELMRPVSERGREIRQFVIVKNKLMSVFNASVLLLTMNFVITLSK